MRRIAFLAFSVWLAVFASVALCVFFLQVKYLRPHPLWGLLTLFLMLTPMAWLTASVLWKCLRGPARRQALGWLLIGATPLAWLGAFLTQLCVDGHTRNPHWQNVHLHVASVWISTILDLDVWWRYPRHTHGRHTVLIDAGQTPSPDKLVAQMDDHIETMARLLGKPVPPGELPWLRGSFFGFDGLEIGVWAISGQATDSAELAPVDRHEMAHALIFQLSGPDQDPPCLLSEGWAQSQSEDRTRLIRNLARRHREGRFYSLQQFVTSDDYRMGSQGPAYFEGGPLAHYLMEHYGPAPFLRLYSGVHHASFHEDCRAILGDSWEAVEANFWKWLETQDRLLAQTHTKPAQITPASHVQLAPSVDPADWQALIEGYQEANQHAEPLPSNTAFSFETELIKGVPTATKPANPAKSEFRAVFEDGNFWIFENQYHCEADSFLVATPDIDATLVRNESGSLEGRVRGAWPRDEAFDLLEFYRREANPESLLPFCRKGIPQAEAAYSIEQVVRPAKGQTDRWTLAFTRRYASDNSEQHFRIELDPARRWWMTRVVRENKDGWRHETNAEYQYLGDALMPVTLQVRREGEQGETIFRWQIRPMSQAERQELKRRVEQAVHSGPTDPYRWLWRLLLTLVIGCPLAGATLLALTPIRNLRSRPRPSMPPSPTGAQPPPSPTPPTEAQ